MTLRSAAFFALVGTTLLAVLVVASFVSNLVNVTRGLVPAITLIRSFVQMLATVSLAAFFYAFHKSQS